MAVPLLPFVGSDAEATPWRLAYLSSDITALPACVDRFLKAFCRTPCQRSTAKPVLPCCLPDNGDSSWRETA